MAYEITNKALAIIVGIAIVANLAVLFTVTGSNKFTAYDVLLNDGTAAVNISHLVAINVTQRAIDFGSGRITADGATGCRLESRDLVDGTGVPQCWTNQSEYLVTGPTGFVIQNVGNVNTSVTVNSNSDANTFIGGTNPTYEFGLRGYDAVSSQTSLTACPVERAGDAFGDVDWKTLDLAERTLCDGFVHDQSLEVDVAIWVPNDAVGQKLSTVYFFGAEV